VTTKIELKTTFVIGSTDGGSLIIKFNATHFQAFLNAFNDLIARIAYIVRPCFCYKGRISGFYLPRTSVYSGSSRFIISFLRFG
jgi:hypothetical protein